MTDAVRTTTLEELVLRCAFRMDDLTELALTKTGNVSEFIDHVNVSQHWEDHTGRQLWLTSGAIDRGVIHIVTDCNQVTHSLSVAPDFGSAPVLNTDAAMINKRGIGYTWLEYRRAIRKAVDSSYPMARTKLSVTAAVDSTGLITVDTTMAEIYEVAWLDDDGFYQPLQRARHRGYEGWDVDLASDQIIIGGQYLIDSLDGRTVRIRGEGKHAVPSVYSDTIKLHPDWVESRACFELALMGMNRDPTGTRARQVLTFQQEYEQRSALISTYREPSSALGRE
jgi:hypothetical protein